MELTEDQKKLALEILDTTRIILKSFDRILTIYDQVSTDPEVVTEFMDYLDQIDVENLAEKLYKTLG